MRYKISLINCFFLFFATTFSSAQSQKFTFQRPKMGSPFVITVFTDDSLTLHPFVEEAYRRVDTLNQIFSDYMSESEISAVCRKPYVWQPITTDLHHLLKISEEAYRASNGAFDITVGNIVKVWRKARKSKHMPDKEVLRTALRKTGFKNIQIDANLPRFKLNTEGVQLDFGGIVKGFAAQEVVNILVKNGFPYCLVDAGGDIVVGKKTNAETNIKDGWKIAISLPNSDQQMMPHFLSLQNQAVATSGDMYQFFEEKGKRYSHIVNPKTGLGLTHQRNITVIAPDGALADWLATACSVLPTRKAMQLIRKYPQTSLLILENKKGKIKSVQSKEFAKYFSIN